MFSIFNRMKRVALPGPGATQDVYQRAFYDPVFDPVGPAIGVRQQMIMYDGKPQNLGSTSAIQQGVAGIVSGQIVFEQLRDKNSIY